MAARAMQLNIGVGWTVGKDSLAGEDAKMRVEAGKHEEDGRSHVVATNGEVVISLESATK